MLTHESAQLSLFPDHDSVTDSKITGIYSPVGQSIYKGLTKIDGNGPNKLTYQKAKNGYPGYFWGVTSYGQTYKVYAFSTIKNFDFQTNDGSSTNVYARINPDGAEALRKWAAREGENANRIRDEQIAHGKVVHRCADNVASQKPLGLYPVSSAPYINALKNDVLPHIHYSTSADFLIGKNGTKIPLSELFVADFSIGAATRFDRIARLNTPGLPYDGYRGLLELKTSGKVKSIEYMEDHIVQAVAGLSLFNTVARICPSLEPLEGIIMAYCYGNGKGDVIPIFDQENLRSYYLVWEQYLNEFAQLCEIAKVS